MLIRVAYLVAFGAAALACFACAFRARRVQNTEVRRALRALLASTGVWAGAYTGLLLATPRWLQLGLYELGLVVGFAAVWAWLWFCFAYTGRSLHRARGIRWAAGTLFLAVTGTKLTNPLHGLYFTARTATEPFSHLAVTPEVLYWLTLGLSYALTAVGFFVLLEFLRRVEGGTRVLAGLFILAGVPGLLTVAGYASSLLLTVPYDSLGVAAFAVGTLYVQSETFEGVGRAGQQQEPAFVVGEDGRIRSANEPALSLVQDVTGGRSASPRRASLAAGDLDAAHHPLRELLPGVEEALEERQIIELDGEHGPRYYRPAESRLGTGSGRLVVLTDVTVEEERRRRQRARLRSVADSIPGVVIELAVAAPEARGADDVVARFVSERAERLLGISPAPEGFFEEFLAGVPASHRDSLLTSIREAVQARQQWKVEIPFGRPGGETIWLLGVAEPSVQGGTTRLTGVLLDVTERKRAEHALRDAKKTAEEAARVKSTLLSNLNHEFRTPLTSIISFSDVVRKEPELAERFAERILSGGKRLLYTLNTVMDFAETEGEALEPTPQTVDLRGVVQSAADSLRTEAEWKGLSLRVETPGEAVRAHFDAHWAERVCTHLLHNAIKFTETGEVAIGVEPGGGIGPDDSADAAEGPGRGGPPTTDLSTAEGSTAGVLLWVEDTGIGIEPDAQPDVFKEFYQASSGLDRTHEGNGLGLTVAKRLVERAGGAIRIDSDPGEGTRVTVRFPSPAET